MRKLKLGLGSEGSHYRGLKVLKLPSSMCRKIGGLFFGKREKKAINFNIYFFPGGRFPEEILSHKNRNGPGLNRFTLWASKFYGRPNDINDVCWGISCTFKKKKIIFNKISSQI